MKVITNFYPCDCVTFGSYYTLWHLIIHFSNQYLKAVKLMDNSNWNSNLTAWIAYHFLTSTCFIYIPHCCLCLFFKTLLFMVWIVARVMGISLHIFCVAALNNNSMSFSSKRQKQVLSNKKHYFLFTGVWVFILQLWFVRLKAWQPTLQLEDRNIMQRARVALLLCLPKFLWLFLIMKFNAVMNGRMCLLFWKPGGCDFLDLYFMNMCMCMCV